MSEGIRKFVALSVHPWADLEVGRVTSAKLRARITEGPGVGFLIAYASREEAEAAEPGAEILEVAPCGAGGRE